MKWLSLLGLDGRVRRVRAAVGEGARAAEDRVQLVRMAWDDEKLRFKRMLLLGVALIGLTTVTVALLSVAVVVQFWDTPHRATAAWSVAALWIVLWLGALIALLSAAKGASRAFAATRRAFERDWAWLQTRFGAADDGKHKPPRDIRPATRDALLRRIDGQRARLADEAAQKAARARAVAQAAAAPAPANESAANAALRVARQHPVATGVATAAVVYVVKPARLLRWGAVLAPVLWRLR